MRKLPIPFNITILKLDSNNTKNLSKITESAIFDSDASKERYHPQGLFSDEIFGPKSSTIRNERFAYIDVKLPILHPVIFQALSSKQLNKDIMSGSAYAIFDYKTNTFIKSDPIDGDTGYNFFIQHLPLLQLEDTGTDGRDLNIKLLNKYRSIATTDKIIVIPAGIRDIDITSGRPEYDDINDIYMKLIRLSNNISPSLVEIDASLADKTRYRLQEAFNELYNAIKDRIDGKKKLILGKWAARKVFNTSRNVITSSAPSGRYLKSKANAGFNDTLVSLYQAMKGVLPKTIYQLKHSYLADIFQDINNEAYLINRDTLKLESVKVEPKVFDMYSSDEGLQNLINRYDHESVRHKPVTVAKHYVSLTYTGVIDGKKVFKIFRDISTLPSHLSKDDVHPTTYTEMFYYVLAPILNEHNAIITRYPISGPGSCQVCKTKVKTSIQDEVRYLLTDDWTLPEISGIDDTPYLSWPILGEKTQEAMSPPHSVLGAMGADFDGDTMSYNPVYSDEATEETNRLLNSKGAYLDAMGNLLRTTSIDTVEYVFFNMTS